MLILVRVWLPDRPGALGQVASRIGAVRGDVLGIDILESGGGRVIDELVVDLADESLVDLLIAEVDAVDGVSVEYVRPLAEDRRDPDFVALQLAATLADTPANERPTMLCDGIAAVADAAWAVVIGPSGVLAEVGTPPDPQWLEAFLAGAGHLGSGGDGPGAVELSDSGPSDLLWARLVRSDLTVAAGRSDRPVHERERVRFALLSRAVDAVITPTH